MKIYHASDLVVCQPDTAHSREYLDFGKGFYLTTIYEQAERYAQRFIRRRRGAWINIYDLNEDWRGWNIMRFDSYDKDWLDFVSKCRMGISVGNYDIVIGGIANDRVIVTLDRYFAGEISQEETLGLLKFEKPNIQYCIRSEEMIKSCLTYIESKKL